jgi:hypothetical protein
LNERLDVFEKNLEEISFCIHDTSDISNSIDLDQFEKLFLDNLNGGMDEYDDELLISNLVRG